MPASTYLTGSFGLIVSVAALTWAAIGVSRRLYQPGPVRHVAAAVVGLTMALNIAKALGALGFLWPLPLSASIVVVSALTGAVARRGQSWGHGSGSESVSEPEIVARHHRLEVLCAGGVLLIASGQWVSHTFNAYSRGMVHPDTNWYHMPFATRFLQTGSFGSLDGLGYEAAHWFPLDGQLLQTLVIEPFHRDLLSPMVNLGWAALALAAAWCIGKKRNAELLAVSMAAVVMTLPIMSATQPGQASTDVGCSALLLASFALLAHSELRPGPTMTAGLAMGLALGTKVSVAIPVVLIAATWLVYLLTKKQWRSAGTWTLAITATATFWFVRNWLLAGSPLPWFAVPGISERITVEQPNPPSLWAAHAFDPDTWNDLYRPGLHQALGPAWPTAIAVVLVAIGGCALAKSALERVLSGTLVVGLVGYAVTPLTSGISFAFNLRYLSPLIMLSAVGVCLVVPGDRRVRIAAGVATLLWAAINTSVANVERIPAWPPETPIAFVCLAFWGLMAVGFQRFHAAPRARGLALAFIVLTLVAGGWPLQSHYGERRYIESAIDPGQPVFTEMQRVTNSRVGLYGAVETYPLFGPDLSNRVELGQVPVASFNQLCGAWKALLSDRYDVVAISILAIWPHPTPPPGVFDGDPNAQLLMRNGADSLYRLHGPLDPSLCPRDLS